MKLAILFLCVIVDIYTFPTQPTQTEKSQACCFGNPQLVYKGHDTKHGINVFVFEFPSLKEDAIQEEAGASAIIGYNNYESGNEYPHSNHLKGKENNPKDEELTSYNDKDVLFGTESFFDNETLDEDDTEAKIYSILSPKMLNVSEVKSKDELFRDTDFNITAYANGVHSKDFHNKDQGKPNEVGDIAGYYSTEGSAYTEIFENNTHYENVTVPNIHINFHSTDMDINKPIECSGFMCWNSTKEKTKTLEKVGKETKTKEDSVLINSNIEQKTHNDQTSSGGSLGHDKKKTKSQSDTGATISSKDRKEKESIYQKKKTKEPIKRNRHGPRIFSYRFVRNFTPKRHGIKSRLSSDSSSESDSNSSQNFN